MLGSRIRWACAIVCIACFALISSLPTTANAQSSGSTEQTQPSQGGAAAATDPAASDQNASIITPLTQHTTDEPYDPITFRQRLRWIVTNSFGPSHLAAGVFAAGFGTAIDRPPEDGTHWDGFGERYGMRLTSIVPGNIMEAGIGAAWGEDPRYLRDPGDHFGGRIRNIVKQTFMARRPDGDFAPAYARFIAIPASNFLSNAWRPESEANNHDAVIRSAEGFAGRMAANTFDEFWPDIKTHVFHRND